MRKKENTEYEDPFADWETVTVGKFEYHPLKMPEYDLKTKEDIDIIADILLQRTTPLLYKDLILNVLVNKYKTNEVSSSKISALYTVMNTDARFEYMGHMTWGLVAWRPSEIKRTRKKKQSKKDEFNEVEENTIEEIDNEQENYDDYSEE